MQLLHKRESTEKSKLLEEIDNRNIYGKYFVFASTQDFLKAIF